MIAQTTSNKAATMSLAVVYPANHPTRAGETKVIGRAAPRLSRHRLVQWYLDRVYALIERPAFERNRKAHNREMLAAYPDNAEFAALVRSDEGDR